MVMEADGDGAVAEVFQRTKPVRRTAIRTPRSGVQYIVVCDDDKYPLRGYIRSFDSDSFTAMLCTIRSGVQ